MAKKEGALAALVVWVCFLGTVLSGCGATELTLSEAEQGAVTQYAASALMKYNAGSNMRLLKGAKLAQAEAEEQSEREKEARRQQLAEEYASSRNEGGGSEEAGAVTVDSGGGTEVIASVEDLGVFLGLDGFSLLYQDVEIVDSYTGSEEGLVMAMDAGQGNKLVVVHFLAANHSEERATLDILSREAGFTLEAGGEDFSAQYTLLLNDLSLYKGELEAGESIDTVLVFELSQEKAEAGGLLLKLTLGDSRGEIWL